jgi:hypothetical protein
MKKITLIVLMIISSFGLFAQSNGTAPLAKGEMQLNFYTGYTRWGIPLGGTFDYAVHKDVTVGGSLGFYIDPSTWGTDFYVGLIFRGDYHWNYLLDIPSNIDFYTGLRLGLMPGSTFHFDGGIQVGGRYYWTDKWGVNVEILGSSNYGFNVGLSMKL